MADMSAFAMGLNFGAGARHGPAVVREASRIIRRLHPTSGIAPFVLCNVADIGDAPVNPLNPSGSIDLIEQYSAGSSRSVRPRSPSVETTRSRCPFCAPWRASGRSAWCNSTRTPTH
jgi:hypothetical protein